MVIVNFKANTYNITTINMSTHIQKLPNYKHLYLNINIVLQIGCCLFKVFSSKIPEVNWSINRRTEVGCEGDVVQEFARDRLQTIGTGPLHPTGQLF